MKNTLLSIVNRYSSNYNITKDFHRESYDIHTSISVLLLNKYLAILKITQYTSFYLVSTDFNDFINCIKSMKIRYRYILGDFRPDYILQHDT